MPHTVDLTAEPRSVVGKKVKLLRIQGIVPGNVYGHGIESTPVQVELKALQGTLRHATSTTLVNLKIGEQGRARRVFVRDVRYNLLRHIPEHVDFFAVRMDEKMRAMVSIVFQGEAPAAKSTDLMLQQQLQQIQVEGLPGDLPESIGVDISHLEEVDQAIHARDLVLPENVTLVLDPDELIVKVQRTRAAIEPVTGADAAEPAEGEAAPEGAAAQEASSESAS